nr:uncharacterized protein LOC106026347 isoform X2 [Cavia porcellus]
MAWFWSLPSDWGCRNLSPSPATLCASRLPIPSGNPKQRSRERISCCCCAGSPPRPNSASRLPASAPAPCSVHSGHCAAPEPPPSERARPQVLKAPGISAEPSVSLSSRHELSEAQVPESRHREQYDNRGLLSSDTPHRLICGPDQVAPSMGAPVTGESTRSRSRMLARSKSKLNQGPRPTRTTARCAARVTVSERQPHSLSPTWVKH